MRNRTLWVLVVAPLLALPSVVGHAAPDPPEYMTRILHDYQDDWGSDQAQTSPGDGHDLIALDVREEYNTTLRENALVFRLALNRGWDGDSTRPELRDVVTFKSKGQSVTKEFKTTDNSKFTGTFDAFSGAVPILTSTGAKDGQRFYVEGVLKWSTLGVKEGDKVSDFFVQGYGGSKMADHMVGGYTLNGQRIDTKPPGDDVSYKRNEYTLRGPVMYFKSSLDKTSVSAKPGDNRTITWTIQNSLGRAQTFTLTADAPTGVDVGLHSARFAMGSLTVSAQAGVTTTVHAYVLPKQGAASGPIGFTVTSDLGGRATHAVPLDVAGSTATETGSDGSPASSPPAKGSPGAPTAVFLVALLVIVGILRRGR